MDKRSIVIAVVIVAAALVFLSWPGGTPPETPTTHQGPGTPAPDAVVETEPVDELPVATVDLDEDDGSGDCDEESDCDG